ncbi:hypothetical protein CYMTET_38327 [Cymbomonas tetramitiformis]|uniref:CCHC-type domain-containing protein n=1 Tax=Cymbomonas tetramitiformis TaxID=36881 RepID=A0AAE0F5L0_9CHLO|nr:hypothetical protein CYMTET_38327 [Cymbomonas tetramitiformis]
MSERSRARRDAKARKRRLAERAGSGSGSDHSVAGSQGVADLTQTISDAVVAKLQQLHSENAGGESSAEVSLGQTPGATQSSQSLSIPAVVAKTQQPQPGNADGEPSAEVSLGQTPGATRTSQPPPSPEDSLSQIARVEEARRKSSEGLTMEEAIKLGFLTVEFPPMKDDMSKPQGLSMELATKLGFLSESHHAAVVTEMVGASTQVCDSTNPKSGTQRAEGRVAKVSFEMDNHAEPPPSRRPYQMPVEELRQLRESIDPVHSDSQSGVACRQLAKMRRSSLDTIVIDGSDSSPAVANDSIGTEEEQWRRISKEKWKAVDRKKAYDGAPRKSTGGMGVTSAHSPPRRSAEGGGPSGVPPDGGAEEGEDDEDQSEPPRRPPSGPPHYPPGGYSGSHRGRAMLVTAEGLSLWTPTPPGYSEFQFDMPTATGLASTGPFGVNLFYKALTLIGMPLTEYISAGGLVTGSPALLLSPAVPTYVMMVNKDAVDTVLHEYHRSPGGRGVVSPSWMEIPDWPLEDQISMLDRDCLAAWFEVQRSQWYVDECRRERNPPALEAPATPPSSSAAPSSSMVGAPSLSVALTNTPIPNDPMVTRIPVATANTSTSLSAVIPHAGDSSVPYGVPPAGVPSALAAPPGLSNIGVPPGLAVQSGISAAAAGTSAGGHGHPLHSGPHAPQHRSPHFAGSVAPHSHARPGLSPHAQVFNPRPPGQGEHDPGDKAAYLESKVQSNIDRLVKKLTRFPSAEKLSKEKAISELETFARNLHKLLNEKVVLRAFSQASCYAGEGRQSSISEVLWTVTETALGMEQKEYMERAGGGSGTSEAWRLRYSDPDIFLGDLAVSTLPVAELQTLRDDLQIGQKKDESADAYHSRLTNRHKTVNFMAKVVQGCVQVSESEFSYIFWRGLTYTDKVGEELRRIKLDLSEPHVWEEKMKEEATPRDVTQAILKVLEIAKNIESRKEKKAAQAQSNRSGERPGRSWNSPSTSPSPSRSFFRSRSREPHRLMAATHAELAAAPTSVRPSPPASTTTPTYPKRVRNCYACQSPDHLVRDCTDAVKLAAWKANAPPRLARNREQVAALFWALSRNEDTEWAPVELKAEIESLAEMDGEAVESLAALVGCSEQLAVIGAELRNSEEITISEEEG